MIYCQIKREDILKIQETQNTDAVHVVKRVVRAWRMCNLLIYECVCAYNYIKEQCREKDIKPVIVLLEGLNV